nr:MAG TPA: hypothetical protein [Caudoviricetes sp.]
MKLFFRYLCPAKYERMKSDFHIGQNQHLKNHQFDIILQYLGFKL